MGAGILPTTIHKGKLYFLFGRENKYEDSAPGFSDFGGGTDDDETFLETAIRESREELTGFLGNEKEIKELLEKYGTYVIDHKSNGHSKYRMFIFPMKYDPILVKYYNNNQRFIQERLSPNIIKTTKIFEKEEIRWICIDELSQMRSEFRHYFQNIVDKILQKKMNIRHFIEKGLKIKQAKNITTNYKTKHTKHTKHNKTQKKYK